MSIDERALEQLIERSEDVQSDAMRTTRESLAELTELGQERRARGGERDEGFRIMRSPLALAAAGLGGAWLALTATAAGADEAADVQILQTAASLENLAVATYATALTLPFIGGASANGVVKAFVMKTKDQHQAHAEAFNAAVKQLGGKEQKNPNPVLLDVVNKAKPTLTAPDKVVDLAIELENGAAQTYVANTGTVGDANARKVFASIMGVEAQHVSILLAVKALLAGGAAQLIALPPDATQLPAAAGSVGFPDAFCKTDEARPADEGAVK
jgi:rubrerythrin